MPIPKVARLVGNIKGNNQDLTDTQSDRMITPEHFAKIQKLIPHQFTLDACANVTGDNRLCERYCSHCDSFLKRDLQNEFIWLNLPFQAAQTFLEHYFVQRDAIPLQWEDVFSYPHGRILLSNHA